MIPFNRPHITGDELEFITEAIGRMQLSSNGEFTRRCQEFLEQWSGTPRVLLTHSCTAALELAALLAGIGQGDEVIMPSFTFVSTANAIALRGATPVFVDIRRDTLNLDESLIEAAITSKTRAICVVHYAGVGANMEAIGEIARRHGLILLEDSAQAMFGSYRGRPLGTFGAFGAISFHETKNVISGEGGALMINDPERLETAQIAWEKGTDRSRFLRGEVDKYTWTSLGSSFGPSEITAAFLWAQLLQGQRMTERRLGQWSRYHAAFEKLEQDGAAQRPVIPAGCGHNGHLYRLLMPSREARRRAIADLAKSGVQAIFHYVPLHDSPAGKIYGKTPAPVPVTEDVSARLIRLPLHGSLEDSEQERVIDAVYRACACERIGISTLARTLGEAPDS